jgi:hypothetical protein
MMKQDNFIKDTNIYIIISELILLNLFTIGCKEKKSEYGLDYNMSLLEHPFVKGYQPDIRERFKLAVEKYQNKTIDTEPILLREGWFVQRNKSEEFVLVISVFDEDKDLLGIIVKEETQNTKGTVSILEEEYPVFISYPHILGSDNYKISFSIRKNNQRKDDKLWEAFTLMDFSELKKKGDKYISNVLKPPPSVLESFSEIIDTKERDALIREWLQTLPPLWISIPDPNTSVWIQVYDKAGHKSNTVQLHQRKDIP